MGLDLTLGGVVLLMGVRGWFKGFILQAIRLVGLITCVYAADPVRDLLKPRVMGYLPTIRPDLVDRLLWWSSAVASYVVIVGLATLALKMYPRNPPSEPDPLRTDQFAGLLLGIAKGLLVAAFLTAGIHKYALEHIQTLPWAVRQTETSWVLWWNETYHPVAKFLATPPVQHWVGHIQRMGLSGLAESPIAGPVATANRPPQLTLPTGSSLGLDPKDLNPDVARAIESIEAEIRKMEQGQRN